MVSLLQCTDQIHNSSQLLSTVPVLSSQNHSFLHYLLKNSDLLPMPFILFSGCIRHQRSTFCDVKYANWLFNYILKNKLWIWFIPSKHAVPLICARKCENTKCVHSKFNQNTIQNMPNKNKQMCWDRLDMVRWKPSQMKSFHSLVNCKYIAETLFIPTVHKQERKVINESSNAVILLLLLRLTALCQA